MPERFDRRDFLVRLGQTAATIAVPQLALPRPRPKVFAMFRHARPLSQTSLLVLPDLGGHAYWMVLREQAGAITITSYVTMPGHRSPAISRSFAMPAPWAAVREIFGTVAELDRQMIAATVDGLPREFTLRRPASAYIRTTEGQVEL
jgi:hypothetical protein